MIDSLGVGPPYAGRPVHVDPAGASAYFITTQASPLERQIYRLDIASGELEQLTQEPGFHLFALSGDGQYLVEQFSNVDTPPITRIVKTGDGSANCAIRSRRAGFGSAPAHARVRDRQGARRDRPVRPARQAGELRPERRNTR